MNSDDLDWLTVGPGDPAAALAHAGLLARLHNGLVRRPRSAAWSADSVVRLLALPGAFAVLALQDGTPAGFALCLPSGDAADLASIGVLPDCRRQGLGVALLAHCENKAARLGHDRLMLEVAAGNAAAIGLYRAAGFDETARREGYYTGESGTDAEDAIIFTKPISSTGSKNS